MSDDNALTKDFMIAAHFDLDKVKSILADHPDLLNIGYDWGNNDIETPIGAAGHMGKRDIAEFLLAQGAPLNICVAAMLGDFAAVKGFLAQDSNLANARGAHGIPLMFHAAMSGDTKLTELLKNHGCMEGYASALHGAINYGHEDMVAWLLANGADGNINVPDFRGLTPLQVANEKGNEDIAELLRQYGASE